MSDSDFLYSAKSNAFVFKESSLLKTDEYSDAVPVDMGVFAEFYPTVKDGMRRVAGPDGMPAWEKIPEPTKEELFALKLAQAESKRDALISAANAYISSEHWPSKLILEIITDEEKATFKEWLSHIDALKKMKFNDEAAILSDSLEWPPRPATAS
ncbi:caudovirales tail fiber assembly family protein [Escherichia coli 3-073-06_S3_C1]|uniref:tail fiber assembly protein n=1 Tax=Escherichia coli TaxID=562 RepID=UPI0004D51F9B|nr:tail fiber assembly protein [Escherichia coli]KDZ59631.1 caudovirales tail fiber assembly family protein [Escherichia coli 3-073-06_S3_C1]